MVFVLPLSRRAPPPSASAERPQPKKRNILRTYAIGLRRVSLRDGVPDLIELTVAETGPAGTPRSPVTVGELTDAALRARLGHSATHSANEIAALRQALAAIDRPITLLEQWPDRASCLLFWSGFGGLQIRRIAWVCEHCGTASEEKIGGSVGESLNRLCGCGKVTRITLPKLMLSPA
jgi:hypothetical protein